MAEQAAPTPLAVVLDALAAPPDPALRAALGPRRHDELRELLRERARAFARQVAGGGEPRPVGTVEALAAMVAERSGPLVAVAPDVPGLDEALAENVREDLAAGIAVSVALAGEGRPYLVALAEPRTELIAAIDGGIEALGRAAAGLGGELGMLRAERRLATVGDARSLLADPITPAGLRDLLSVLG